MRRRCCRSEWVVGTHCHSWHFFQKVAPQQTCHVYLHMNKPSLLVLLPHISNKNTNCWTVYREKCVRKNCFIIFVSLPEWLQEAGAFFVNLNISNLKKKNLQQFGLYVFALSTIVLFSSSVVLLMYDVPSIHETLVLQIIKKIMKRIAIIKTVLTDI